MLYQHKKLLSFFPFLFCFLFLGCTLDFTKVYEYEEVQSQLGKRIAVFPAHGELIYGDISLPEGLKENLEKKVIGGLLASGKFEEVLHGEELEAHFQNDGELFQKKEIYLDTLYSTALSDSDLSPQIGQSLGVDSLVVLQVSYWGIKECEEVLCSKNLEEGYDQKITLRIKLRALDQMTGKASWIGIHELDPISLNSPLELQESAYQITDLMIKKLYDDFYTQILEPLAGSQSFASLL